MKKNIVYFSYSKIIFTLFENTNGVTEENMAKKNIPAKSTWDGNAFAFLFTILAQLVVFALFVGAGAYLATFKVLSNGTPWMEDIKNPTTIALVLAGAVLAAIGFCWACIIGIKYKAKHTIVNGQRMQFKSNTIALFFNVIKWTIFTVITVGIYLLWLPASVRRWVSSHMTFAPANNEAVRGQDYTLSYFQVDDNGNREEFNFVG